METPAPHFIRNWLLACLLFAAAIAGFNALVDPYLLFNGARIRGFNDRKPSVETQERLMKAYEVTRAAPKSLILGTSRVDMGLDTNYAAWPANARPIYNLGLAAANPYTSLRYLQHAAADRKLELVVLGLDFEYFLTAASEDRGAGTEFESRLAVNADGAPNSGRGLQRARDLFEGTLTLDALLDSAATVLANRQEDSANLARSGDLSEAGLRSEAMQLGSYSLFAQRDLRNIRFYSGKIRDDRAMADIRAIVALCKARGTRLVLFINPVHADMLETFDLLGFWSGFEDWKRQLATVIAAAAGPQDRGLIELWDFSGYDAYSGESVPAAGRAQLKWFWEPSHYTKALGDTILDRIFGGSENGYGELLTPASVESRLAAVRDARRTYRESHSDDVRRIRDIYDSSVGLTHPATASLR